MFIVVLFVSQLILVFFSLWIVYVTLLLKKVNFKFDHFKKQTKNMPVEVVKFKNTLWTFCTVCSYCRIIFYRNIY